MDAPWFGDRQARVDLAGGGKDGGKGGKGKGKGKGKGGRGPSMVSEGAKTTFDD